VLSVDVVYNEDMRNNNENKIVAAGEIIKHGFRDYGFTVIVDGETLTFTHVHYSRVGAMMFRSEKIKELRQ